MIKKSVKFLILLIVFLAIVWGIYKSPELIMQKETQEQLLETADKLDSAIEELTETGSSSK